MGYLGFFGQELPHYNSMRDYSVHHGISNKFPSQIFNLVPLGSRNLHANQAMWCRAQVVNSPSLSFFLSEFSHRFSRLRFFWVFRNCRFDGVEWLVDAWLTISSGTRGQNRSSFCPSLCNFALSRIISLVSLTLSCFPLSLLHTILCHFLDFLLASLPSHDGARRQVTGSAPKSFSLSFFFPTAVLYCYLLLPIRYPRTMRAMRQYRAPW